MTARKPPLRIRLLQTLRAARPPHAVPVYDHDDALACIAAATGLPHPVIEQVLDGEQHYLTKIGVMDAPSWSRAQIRQDLGIAWGDATAEADRYLAADLDARDEQGW